MSHLKLDRRVVSLITLLGLLFGLGSAGAMTFAQSEPPVDLQATPVLTLIPAYKWIGSRGFNLTVLGSGFAQGNVVRW